MFFYLLRNSKQNWGTNSLFYILKAFFQKDRKMKIRIFRGYMYRLAEKRWRRKRKILGFWLTPMGI